MYTNRDEDIILEDEKNKVFIGDKMYIIRDGAYHSVDDGKVYYINGDRVYCSSDGSVGYVDENGIHICDVDAIIDQSNKNIQQTQYSQNRPANGEAAQNNTFTFAGRIYDKTALKKEAGKMAAKGAIGAAKLGAKGIGTLMKQAMGLNPWQK